MQPSGLIKILLIFHATLLLISCTEQTSSIKIAKNIFYNQHGQQLDLYIPAKLTKKTAIMFIHGGSFKAGNKEEMATFANYYAQKGYVTSSINYRLIPEHTYPAHVNDVSAALSWMKKHAHQFTYDANKIVVVGYSAGGTLALNLGLDATKNVAATVGVAPVTDMEALMHNAPLEVVKADLTIYLGDKAPSKAAPISQVNQRSAPTLLFHGDQDEVVPISQSIALKDKLTAHHVPVRLRIFSGAGHEIMLPNKHLNQLIKEMTSFIQSIEAS